MLVEILLFAILCVVSNEIVLLLLMFTTALNEFKQSEYGFILVFLINVGIFTVELAEN